MVVYALTSFISMPLFNSLAQSFDIQGDLPFQSGGAGALVASAFFFLVVDAILYPLFGALGAYVASALMRKPAQV